MLHSINQSHSHLEFMAYKKSFFKSALSYDRNMIANYKYQISIQTKVLQAIKASLPNNLSSHALHCVFSDNKISLYTDSATWSSQLRFYRQAILQAASNSNQGVFETLKIKIIPKINKLENKNLAKTPSSENIDYILDQAESQSDEKLQSALLNLGNTLRNKAKK